MAQSKSKSRSNGKSKSSQSSNSNLQSTTSIDKGKQQQQQQQSYHEHQQVKQTKSEEKSSWSNTLINRQIQIPTYILLALSVCHILSSSSTLSLSLSHSLSQISSHLPSTLKILIPTWVKNGRKLTSLVPFPSDLPNASHKRSSSSSFYNSNNGAGGGNWPFRSEALGFGHPLTTLHEFTKSCLGLSYPILSISKSSIFDDAFHLGGGGGGGEDDLLNRNFVSHSTGLPNEDALYSSSSSSRRGIDSESWNWLFPSTGKDSNVEYYSKGYKDALYVLTWILIWTALRATFIKFLLIPLGESIVVSSPTTTGSGNSEKIEAEMEQQQIETQISNQGVCVYGNGNQESEIRRIERIKARRAREKDVNRFAEQAWSVIFYVVYWSLGLYVGSHQDYWPFDTSGFWRNYPHLKMDGITKFYYLTACAFWFHQVIVLNVEAKRKDHYQMLSHHFITILLVVGSYWSNFTAIGNAILCLMDPCDILLSSAKVLKYVGASVSCDIAFVLFLVGWTITRQILLPLVILSIIYEGPRLKPFTNWSNLGLDGNYWTRETNLIFTALLIGLQIILCVWFVMIIRVAWKVVKGYEAEDTRSDVETSSESESEDEDEDENENENEIEIESSREGKTKLEIEEEKGRRITSLDATSSRTSATTTRTSSTRKRSSHKK